jgi:hypothetical protein
MVFTVVIFKHTDPAYEWNTQNVAAVVAVWAAITTAIVRTLARFALPKETPYSRIASDDSGRMASRKLGLSPGSGPTGQMFRILSTLFLSRLREKAATKRIPPLV